MKSKSQKLFSRVLGGPECHGTRREYDNSKPWDFKPEQIDAVKAICGERHVILNAPTGFGKSCIIAFVCLWRMIRDRKLKCIIAVPQTVIAGGFAKALIFKVVNVLVEWTGGTNLCGNKKSERVNDLIEFLKSPPLKSPNRYLVMGRLLICSHSALAAAHRRLKKRRLDCFKNTLVWIDEAHHVMNAQIDGRRTTRSNRIGGLVMDLVRRDHLKAQIGLATATFMRSDMRHIVPDSIIGCFKRYNVPYDVYFRMMETPLTFDFTLLLGDARGAINAIFRKRFCPTIIYLAKRNSVHATNCKYTEVGAIIKQLAKILKVKPRRDGDVIRLGDAVVLDLVTEEGRERRKAYLLQVAEGKQPLDIIIALNMCQEGFDWPQAQRSIIIGERHSVPELIQMIGRLFRESKGKTHAEVFQVLPSIVRDKGKFRNDRNRHLTVIFAAMLLENVFVPQAFSSKPSRTGSQSAADIVPSADTWQTLVRDFQLTIGDGMSYDDSLPHMAPLLNRHGIEDENHRFLWDRLWGMGAVLTLRMRGKHITNNIALDLLKQTSPTEGLFTLASGLLGLKTMDAVREALGSELKTPEQWVPIAEKLAWENGGKLPHCHRLVGMGMTGLVQAMRLTPRLFEHIDQEYKGGRTLKDNVLLANKLKRKHGKLPNAGWLIKNGYKGLYAATQAYPQAFEHIDQEYKGGRTLKDNVLLANTLEQKHGQVPNQRWLRDNGYCGLATAIRKYPKAFKHIRQVKKQRSREDYVALALKLKREYGKLPNSQWLAQNGYSGIRDAMKRHPQSFEHIPQLKLNSHGQPV